MNNHSRFFSLLKLQSGYTREYSEVLKEALVFQYSAGSTNSLSEFMHNDPAGYEKMLRVMESGSKMNTDNIKTLRSKILRMIGRIGIDTSGTSSGDWSVINRFLLSPRISGKQLNHMTLSELKSCLSRLQVIETKTAKQKV